MKSLCAGAGGMDPGVVASAILRGVNTATSSAPLFYLTDIRLVLIKINVFLEFKEEATQMFSTAVVNRGDSFLLLWLFRNCSFSKMRIPSFYCVFSLIVVI